MRVISLALIAVVATLFSSVSAAAPDCSAPSACGMEPMNMMHCATGSVFTPNVCVSNGTKCAWQYGHCVPTVSNCDVAKCGMATRFVEECVTGEWKQVCIKQGRSCHWQGNCVPSSAMANEAVEGEQFEPEHGHHGKKHHGGVHVEVSVQL